MKTKVTFTDGTTREITVIHADKVRGEMASHQQGLPSLQDAPITGVSVHVWAACKRLFPDTTSGTFSAWLDTVEDLSLDEDSSGNDAVNPQNLAAL
ncbi:hypothetical protein [Corynebacterium propinquum]|uniref:hypothetical protein n=1 Tax=Corynebacterium propinquum TaxID=43769 RepID=UPI001EF1AE41|nr:hypothetical protein [Corynebacterium propinquum]